MSLVDLLADPLEGRPIGERMRHALALFLLATWTLGVIVLLTRPPAYPPWFAAGANGLLAAGIVLQVITWRSPQGSLRAAQLVVLLATVVRLVEAVALHQPRGLVDYLPMTYVLTMALGGTGIAFRPAVGLPIMLGNLAGLLIERFRSVGLVQSGAEAGYIAAAGLAGFLLARALSDELARVEEAAATTQQRRNEAVLAMERTGLRERWDALVHDTVLASLTLAARGQVEEAAVLAAEALRELSGSRPAREDPVATIAAHADRLGIDVRFDVGDWLPGRPGEALVVATCEALTNVARHSGERRASVSSHWADEGVLRVVIEDDGRGFDPHRVGERRLGIRHAIHASMKAVGGGAEIQSSPGRGTRVILHALPIEPPPVEPAGTRSWSMASLAWFSVLFALEIASGVVIGGLYLHDQVVTSLSVAGMILIPVLTVLLAFVPVRRGWWTALLVTVGAVWAALLGNVRDLTVIDWRTWFVGSFDAAVVLIALRDRLRRALLVIAGATLAGSVLLLARGVFSAWAVVEATYQTVVWAAASGYSRRLMDRASAQVAGEAAAQVQAWREEQVADARDEEIRTRRRSLDADVVPMLRRVAAGEVLADDDRRVCALLEATTRDQLAAATLLTGPLAASIKRARQRGVSVSIAGRRDPGTDLGAFHEAAARMLAIARPGDRVHLVWRDTPGERSGSACLVGAGVAGRWPAEVPRSDARTRRDVSVDDDSVLVELTASPSYSASVA
ncbi:MAG TPA: ATP-binding protein [Propionibacteriaceae bacterium]|nr:ATP-binding protein [Propionibacteriaceae bacterium]